jgi:hypothetical protein
VAGTTRRGSPALGLSYYIWRRTRWLVIAAAIYLLILAAAVRLIPTIASPLVCVPLLAPLAAIVIGLLGTLTLEQVNFDAAASIYPTHLLIRPATTRSLVLWPMLYAVAIAGGAVLLIDRLLLAHLSLPDLDLGPRPINIVLPLIAASFISWLQVISWFPIPFPFGRIVAFTLANLLVFAGNVCLYKIKAPQSVMALMNVALVLLAYETAVAGVRRARRGTGQTPTPLISFSPFKIFARGPRRPFRSPAAAQFWLECRRNIFGPTAFACAIALFALPLSVIGSSNARKTGSVNLLTPDAGIVITGPILNLAFATAGPILIFLAMSVGLGKFDLFTKETRWPSFASIRPLSSAGFVVAKLKALAVAAAITAALMSIIITLSWLNMIPSDRALALTPLARFGPITRIILLSLLPLVAAFTIWRNTAVGLALPFTGRSRLVTTFTFANFALISLVFLAGVWIYRHPSVRQNLKSITPALVIAAAVIKLLAAITACVALDHLQLISRRAIFIAASFWFVLALSIGITLRELGLSAALLIPMIILAIPFTRLAAAPLALHWNRHR